MIDPATLKARFPEFACENDTRIQIFIDDSSLILNPVFWGDKYDMGLSYYTAHLLTSGNKTKAGSTAPLNPVNSRAVDGVSVSYSVPTGGGNTTDEGFLNSTSYGQRYLALRKTLGVAACVL